MTATEGLEPRLRQLAAEQAEAVLAEATESARRQAVDILASRLTELILQEAADRGSARVQSSLEEEPTGATGPTVPLRAVAVEVDPPAEASPDSGWYLYGLTWPDIADAMAGGVGIGGTTLQSVPVGAVAAVISPVGDTRPWGIGDGGEVELVALSPQVAEHQRVLEEILERGPVVPLRFGVMYPELSALVSSLKGASRSIAAELRRLDGLVEWGLTIEWSASRVSRPSTASPENGRQYLTRRQQDRAAAEVTGSAAVEAAGVVHTILAGIAADAVVHTSRGTARGDRPAILRASYLVPQSGAVAFRQAAGEALASAPGDLELTGDLTGPWPAYNFVDIHLQEAV